MKQKLIYLVLVMTVMNLPASSRECGKLSCCPLTQSTVVEKAKPVVAIDEPDMLAVSPFSRLLFNL